MTPNWIKAGGYQSIYQQDSVSLINSYWKAMKRQHVLLITDSYEVFIDSGYKSARDSEIVRYVSDDGRTHMTNGLLSRGTIPNELRDEFTPNMRFVS